jgi:hypothetical protein
VRGFDQIDIRRLVGRAAALDCPLKKVTAVRKARVAGSGRAGLSVASAVVGCPWRLHMCPDDAVWEDCDARYASASFVMPFILNLLLFPRQARDKHRESTQNKSGVFFHRETSSLSSAM